MILFIFHLAIYVLGAIATYELVYHVEMDGDNLPGSRYHHGELHHGTTRDDAAALAFVGSLIWPLAVLFVVVERVRNRERHEHR